MKLPCLSSKTKCLHCHIVSNFELIREGGEEECWQCTRCGYEYPVKFWRIKKARKQERAEVETI